METVQSKSLQKVAEEEDIFLPVGLYLPEREISLDDAIARLEKMKKGTKLPPIRFEFQGYADIMVYWQKVLESQQPYLEVFQSGWRTDLNKLFLLPETPTKCTIYRLSDTEEAVKIIEKETKRKYVKH